MSFVVFVLLFPSFFSPSFVATVVIDSLHASLPPTSISSRDSSLYFGMEYIFKYGQYLDARSFGAIRIMSDRPSIYYRQFEKYRETGLGLGLNPGVTVAAQT